MYSRTRNGTAIFYTMKTEEEVSGNMDKKLDKNNFFDFSACLLSILLKLEKIEKKTEKI